VKHVTVIVLAVTAFAAAHPWACYHGDRQHTGRSDLAVGDSLWQDWSYATGSEISGSPVVNDQGQVLFGARNVHLYCLNPGGSPAWDANLESLGSSIYFSTPALDDSGNAYITTNRKLVKVNREGTVLWSFPDHGSWSISHSPVIGQDGKIYFACYNDSLMAVLPDGSLAWARELGNDVNSAPAIGLDGNVYVATTRGAGGWKLWAFQPDGSVAWSFDLAGDADFASPTIGPDSTVYVGAGRYLYAVGSGGSLRWRDSLTAQVSSCPAIANDSTLYLTAGSFLYCLSADSGWRWRKSLGGSNYSAPAVDRLGRVYVGSASGSFYVIGPDSTVLWTASYADYIWSSPAIGANGRVYFGCMDGNFYALAGDGLGVEETPVPAPAGRLALSPNPSLGRVRLGTSPVRVRVMDVSGRARQFVRTGAELDLDGLESGIYVVEAETGTGRSSAKLVLK
jgi:outer membrane protein assembly factor BamB